MAEHLDSYVMDFIDQFEVMHDDIQFGDEIKEGSYRYPFSLKYLRRLEKFFNIKNMTVTNAGHMWICQDLHVINPTYNVGLAVIISYNEMEQILSFAPHAYFYLEDSGLFSPFATYEDAMRVSKRKKTQAMIHEMN
jgi:hypothetical protein